MNHVYTSLGEKIKRPVFDRKVNEAKKLRMQMQVDEIGYNVCSECNQNDCKPVDASHDISVKWCVENRQAELAYDVNNITPRGRECHKKHDGLDLKFHNNIS